MKAHIIDPDVFRRGKLSREIFDRGGHPEVFGSLEEFLSYRPKEAYVLLYEPRGSRSEAVAQSAFEEISGGYHTVMYSDDPDLEKVVSAMVAGALDYLKWPIPDAKIDELISSVTERERLRFKEESIRRDAEQVVSELTTRERQVLALVTRGLGNKSIARELGISPRTVEIHRANCFAKLNAGSTADAVRIGVHAGLDRDD